MGGAFSCCLISSAEDTYNASVYNSSQGRGSRRRSSSFSLAIPLSTLNAKQKYLEDEYKDKQEKSFSKKSGHTPTKLAGKVHSTLSVAVDNYMKNIGFDLEKYGDLCEEAGLNDEKLTKLVKENALESFVADLTNDPKQSSALVMFLSNYQSESMPSFSAATVRIVRDAANGEIAAIAAVLSKPLDYVACTCYLGLYPLLRVILYDNVKCNFLWCIPILFKFDIDHRFKNSMTGLMYASLCGHLACAKLLISSGASVDATSSDGITPFLFACMGGHTQLAVLLLSYGADMHQLVLNEGTAYSALSLACSGKHLELLNLLIERGANLDFIDTDGSSLLLLACMSSSYEVAEILVRNGCDVHARQAEGYSAIYLACGKGYQSIVRLLLENGADPNATDSEGGTPLMLACISDSYTAAQMLIEYHADVNLCDHIGVSPLMLACDGGYNDIVRLLVTHNVDLNASMTDGWTALMLACSGGYVDVVELLINQGAYVEATDAEDYTVLMAACGGGNIDIVKLLISQHVNLNFQDVNGRCALLIACLGGYSDMLALLLNSGATVNIADMHGTTPLMAACLKDLPFAVNLLLDFKADTNAVDMEGSTALMIAAKSGNLNIVMSLIFKEADVTVRRKDGRNAMTFASKSRHVHIMEALFKNRSPFNAQVPGGYPSTLSDVCEMPSSEKGESAEACITYLLRCHEEASSSSSSGPDGGVEGIFSNEDILAARFLASTKRFDRVCELLDSFPVSGNYKILMPEVGEYDGTWVNSKRHGKGILRMGNGTSYDGDWDNDTIHGYGTKTWGVSSSVYTGLWNRGKRSGHGLFVYANGMRHEGEFLNDNAHGQGLRTWTNGAYFTGSFSEDKCIKGQVSLVTENLKPYACVFGGGDDIVDGFRVYDDLSLFLPDGSLYKSGPFSNGQFLTSSSYLGNLSRIINRQGDQENSTLVDVTVKGNVDRIRYLMNQGSCRNDELLAARLAAINSGNVDTIKEFTHLDISGNYKVVLPNIGVYEGEWRKNKRHGKGVLMFDNGDIYDGSWADDNINGMGVFTDTAVLGSTCIAVYSGGWVNNKRSGQGCYTYANGLVHDGSFFNNKAHGQGKRTYSNGSYFVGQFENDKCTKGDLYLASENLQLYYTVFTGGDDIVDGFRLYDVAKLYRADQSLYKTGPFSNGELLSQEKYVSLMRKLVS